MYKLVVKQCISKKQKLGFKYGLNRSPGVLTVEPHFLAGCVRYDTSKRWGPSWAWLDDCRCSPEKAFIHLLRVLGTSCESKLSCNGMTNLLLISTFQFHHFYSSAKYWCSPRKHIRGKTHEATKSWISASKTLSQINLFSLQTTYPQLFVVEIENDSVNWFQIGNGTSKEKNHFSDYKRLNLLMSKCQHPEQISIDILFSVCIKLQWQA